MKLKALIILAATAAACITINGQEQNDPLVGAYKKEFVFLDTEIRLLKDRVAEIETDGVKRVRTAEAEVDRLEEKLIRLDLSVQQKTEDLRMLEEQNSGAEEAAGTLNAILEQAALRLEKASIPRFHGGSEDPSDNTIEEIRYVFSESLALLEKNGRINREEGSFFLSNGKKTNGDIVRIGQIASFGSDGEVSGPLVPAGSGALRIDRNDNSSRVKELLSGKTPDKLTFFLYESLDNSVETSKKKTMMDTVKGGGFIGVIIILLGAASLILIILRILLLGRNGKGVTDDIEELADMVEKRDWDHASASARSIPGSLGRVLEATVKGLKNDPEKADDTIAESIMNEQPRLDRFRIPLSVFAAVSPLLGLLGTVTGMIATFDIITVYGTGDPKLLSGGISEALITTQLGLMVAIPTLLIGNLLSSRSTSITSALETKALRLVNAFSGKDSVKAG